MFLTCRIGRDHDILEGCNALYEVKLLEDKTKGFPPDFRKKPLREARYLATVNRETLPSVGFVIAPITLNTVVFPEPLGPFKTVIRKGSMVRLTSSTAQNSFALPLLKIFVTW
jgi:hypothetical protein